MCICENHLAVRRSEGNLYLTVSGAWALWSSLYPTFPDAFAQQS